jgi:peptidoglycan hydrolase-like protein with peptidoglycan-binding domain
MTMPDLTANELRAVAYYSIGVGSEGGDIAYQLSFCGDTISKPDGSAALRPIGNSGYTIGEMQTDFGAQPEVAKDLVGSFQDWAKTNHKDWVLSEDQKAQLEADLGRNGRHIRDGNYDADNKAYMQQHHGKSMPDSLLPRTGQDIDPVFKAHLDSYLATDAGKAFTHRTDVAQVDELVSKVGQRLEHTDFYKNATPDDQAKIFSIVAKAYNQGPAYVVGSKNITGIFEDIDSGKIGTMADLNMKVDSFPDYMRTGRDAAVKGAELFNSLQNAGARNPMREPWQAVVGNPLVDPTQVGNDPKQPHLANQYATVKGSFVDPAEGRAFVAALEKGGSHNYGDPGKSHSRGFYAEGKDFVQWDRDGHGRAFVGGQWSDVQRSELSLVHNKDHTLDVDLTRNGKVQSLLHVTHPSLARGHADAAAHAHESTLHQGMHSAAVQQLQTRLGEMGYLENTGTPDGKFGPITGGAVMALQHDHHLAASGRVDPATQQAIQASLQPLKQDGPGAVAATPSPSTGAPGLDDPRNAVNPNHALFNDLKQRFPDASDNRLLQFTAACHANGINDRNLQDVRFDQQNGIVNFGGREAGQPFRGAAVDVKEPSPQPAQSIQQIEQFDRHQAQVQASAQAQIVQTNAQAQQGPGLAGH